MKKSIEIKSTRKKTNFKRQTCHRKLSEQEKKKRRNILTMLCYTIVCGNVEEKLRQQICASFEPKIKTKQNKSTSTHTYFGMNGHNRPIESQGKKCNVILIVNLAHLSRWPKSVCTCFFFLCFYRLLIIFRLVAFFWHSIQTHTRLSSLNGNWLHIFRQLHFQREREIEFDIHE